MTNREPNCFINQDPTEYRIPDFCHVYSASAWHDDAFIVAGTDALLKIKDTIDKALESGQSSCALFVNDGEGFDLIVVNIDDSEKQYKLRVPYTEKIAAGNQGLCPHKIFDYAALIKGVQASRANKRLNE